MFSFVLSLWLFADCIQVLRCQPNILLILVDDMGNSDASYNFKLTSSDKIADGVAPPILTPNIDYLAEHGIIFANHYTNMICGPSRSALLSSRFAYKIGNPFAMRTSGHLLPKYKTFAHELQARGFRTHFIGKYGIDSQGRSWDADKHQYYPPPSHNDELGPLSRGFDTFYGLYNSAHDHFKKTIFGAVDWHKFNETHLLEAPDTLDAEPTVSSTHCFTRETIEVIQQNTNTHRRPWFVHLSFTMPHDPMMVDEKYIADREFEHCRKIRSWRRKVYCGMVASVDEGIGNITRYLREQLLLQNTVVMFSSDNGGFPNVGGFNYPYRGMKISPYEGGVKTIAFIYGPTVFPKANGNVFTGNIHIVDWGPTLLGIVDAAAGKTVLGKHDIMGDGVDGLDFSETLKRFAGGGVAADDRSLLSREEFIVEARWWNNMTVYRYKQYKLFLGTMVYDQLFSEPDDTYALSAADRQRFENYDWIVTDWINFFIANFLGTDYFWYEWNVTIMLRMLYLQFVLRDKQCPEVRPPFMEPPPPNNQTFHFPYVDDWRPVCQRVRLYDLENDPSESNNLAYSAEYQDVVAHIMDQLIHKIEKEYELGQIEYDVSSEGLQAFVNQTQQKLVLVVIAVGLLLLITVGVCLICCYRCCCRNQKYRKQKTE